MAIKSRALEITAFELMLTFTKFRFPIVAKLKKKKTMVRVTGKITVYNRYVRMLRFTT